jgi:hypothetical protein
MSLLHGHCDLRIKVDEDDCSKDGNAKMVDVINDFKISRFNFFLHGPRDPWSQLLALLPQASILYECSILWEFSIVVCFYIPHRSLAVSTVFMRQKALDAETSTHHI